MYTTRDEIAHNLQNPEWLAAFAKRHLSDLLQLLEKTYEYEKSDRDSVPAIEKTDYLPERGLVLWSCHCEEDHSSSRMSLARSTEVVLLESGNLSVLTRSHKAGFTRSDMEAYSSYIDRRIQEQHRMTDHEFEKYGSRIARELFGLAVEQEEKIAGMTYSHWDTLALPETLTLHLDQSTGSRAEATVEGELRYFCITANLGYKLIHEKYRDLHEWGSGGEKGHRFTIADESWQVLMVATICHRYHTESDDSTDHHISTDLTIRTKLESDQQPLKSIIDKLNNVEPKVE